MKDKNQIIQSKKQVVLSVLLIFCAVILPKVVLIMFSSPLRTASDEIGTLSVASYVAGLDWSGVIPYSGYYGFGFTSIFSWIFSLTDNPYIIYRFYLMISVVLQSSGAFISYYICKKYNLISSNIVCVLLSIICGYMVVTRANVVYNEQMLICVSWLILLLLFGLLYNQNNREKKMKYSFLIALLLVYSLTVHVRALIYFLALVCLIILYGWYNKKLLLDLKIFVPVFLIGYIVCNYLSGDLQELLWKASEGLRNTNISVSVPTSLLFSPAAWHAWANIVVGQVFTITIVAGGITIPILLYLYGGIKNIILKRNIDFHINNNYFIMLFFAICIGGTILGQSISWLPDAVNAIIAGVANNEYGTKAFTYIRYFGPYVGPVIMLGIIHLVNNFSIYRKKMESLIWIFLLLTFYWLVAIYPYFFNTEQTGTLEALYPFSLSSVLDVSRIRTTLPSCLITIGLFIVIVFLIRYKKAKIILIILLCSLGYQYIYNAIMYDISYQNEQVKKVADTYHILNDVKYTLLPEDINVYDSKDRGHGTYFTYQFYFNRLHIEVGIPEKLTEEYVLLSDINLDLEIKDYNTKEFCIKENQYIYTNLKGLCEYLDDLGY